MTLPKTARLHRDGTVRIGSSAAIPAILKRFGTSLTEVLDEAGLEPSIFDDPDNVITYAGRSHLIKICVEKTGCKHFGLLMGQPANISSFGLVGYLVKNSPDVHTALQNLIHYFHMIVQGATVTLTVEEKMALLSYNIYQPGIEASEQLEDGAIAIAFNMLRSLCGQEWCPVEIRFTHRKPEDIAPFRKFFHAPLYFNAEQNGILFHVSWLKSPVQDSDPELYRLLKKQVDDMEASHHENFPNQVQRVLHTALLSGQASADQVAQSFSIHSRTMNRRLKTFNTSFKALVDQTRYEISQHLLENSELEIIQIAATLNYADASAFTRAFRRWSGMTPSAWREQFINEDLAPSKGDHRLSSQ